MKDYFKQNFTGSIHVGRFNTDVTDVATKIGTIIDVIAPQTNGGGRLIGKGIDEITKDKTINIGKK